MGRRKPDRPQKLLGIDGWIDWATAHRCLTHKGLRLEALVQQSLAARNTFLLRRSRLRSC